MTRTGDLSLKFVALMVMVIGAGQRAYGQG